MSERECLIVAVAEIICGSGRYFACSSTYFNSEHW